MATATIPGTMLDERIYRGDQSLRGTRTVQVRHRPTPRLLRARIVRDAYDAQCTAIVETWHGERGWDEVATVPIKDLLIADWSYATVEEKWRDTMRDSLSALIALGYRILEGT